jgi:hypothetical protein
MKEKGEDGKRKKTKEKRGGWKAEQRGLGKEEEKGKREEKHHMRRGKLSLMERDYRIRGNCEEKRNVRKQVL